jgi:hypothetical protein
MVALEIMITEYEKKGLIQAGYDKIQIIHGKVPGAEDQIDAGKTFFNGR